MSRRNNVLLLGLVFLSTFLIFVPWQTKRFLGEPKEGMELAFGKAVPVFPVKDLKGALRFYGEELGFRVVRTGEGHAVFQRGEAELHVWECGERWKEREGSCRIGISGLRVWLKELHSRNVLMRVRVQSRFLPGSEEFDLLDPDGNLIRFYEIKGNVPNRRIRS